MSTIIDNNIVQMTFDNKTFEKGVRQTLETIEKLKSALNFKGFEKGLNVVKNGFSEITVKTSLMEKAVTASVQRMTNQMVTYGQNMVKSLSADQITAGWEKYAEKTTGVQTIMAATGKSIDEVNESLEKLNWFTDETSYNFTDMVTNIGKFTSQGIDLDTAVSAMEGISTWAAVSGQGVNEASRAMYNLAQAIGVGSVKLMDWKSIENANMGTKEFKEQAIAAAVAAGTLGTKMSDTGETLYYAMDQAGKKMTKTQVTFENFSQTLSEGWFTSDVLINVLKDYGSYADSLYDLSDYVQNGISKTTSEMIEDLDKITDVTTDAEIIQMGYTEEAIEKIRELANTESVVAKKSFKAAQEAKTFAEAIASVKDAVSTGWMTTFEKIFGNYEQAKRLWTDLANDLYEVFAEGGNERNEMLAEWSILEEGGRDDLIQGFKDLFEAVNNVRLVVKDAFHDIFPKKTAEDIANIVKRFKSLAERLRENTSTMERFKNGLRGVFSFVKIIKSVVEQVYTGFNKVFGGTVYGMLNKFLDAFDKFGKKMQDAYNVINRTSRVLKVRPLVALTTSLAEILSTISSKLYDIFGIIKKVFSTIFAKDMSKDTEKTNENLTKLEKIVIKIVPILSKIKSKIDSIDVNKYTDTILKNAGKVNSFLNNTKFYIENFFKAITGQSYMVSLNKNWEKAGRVIEHFGERLVLLGDVFEYYFKDISTAEHKGEAFLDAVRGVFPSIAWVISESMGDSTKSLKGFLKTAASKIDTKMFEWFGHYWTDLRSVLVAVHTSLKRIFESIASAADDVFGTNLQKDLKSISNIVRNITDKIVSFAKALYVTEERADLLKRTFRGLFSIVDIVKDVFLKYTEITTGIKNDSNSLITALLSISAAIGDILYNLDKTLEANNTIEKFIIGYMTLFRELGRVASEIIGVVVSFFSALIGSTEESEDPIEKFDDAMEKTEDTASTLGNALDSIADKILEFGDILKKLDFTKTREKAFDFGKKFLEVAKTIRNGLMYVVGFVTSFPSSVKSMFDNAKSKIDEKYPAFQSKLNEIKDKILGVWSDIKAIVDPIIDDIKSRFENIGGFLSSFGDDIKSLGSSAKSAFTDFATGFSDAFTKINSLFSNTGDISNGAENGEGSNVFGENSFINKMIDGLKKLYPKTTEAIDTYWPSIKSFFEKARDVVLFIIDEIGPKLKQFWDDVTISDLLKFLTTGGLALAIKGLGDAVGDIGDIVEDKFKSFGGGKAASTFDRFTKALLRIVASMLIITLIPDDKIEFAMGVIAKIGIALMTIMAFATTSSIFMTKESVQPKQLSSMSSVLLGISLLVMGIAAALKKVAKIPEEGLVAATGAITTILGLILIILGVVTKNVASMKDSGDAFKHISSIIKSMGLLVVELAVTALIFHLVDFADIGKALTAFSSFILILIGTLKLFSKAKITKTVIDNMTLALKKMVGMFAVFAVLGLIIQHVNFTAMYSAIGAFALLLVELVGALFIFKKSQITKPYVDNFAKAISSIMVAFAAFAALAIIVQNIDFLGILKAVGIFAIVIVTLTAALAAFKYLKISSSVVEAFAIAIGVLSASFLVFSTSIYVLVLALEKLVTLLEEHPKTVYEALEIVKSSVAIFIAAIINGIKELFVQIVQTIFDVLSTISENVPVFTELLTNLLMVIINVANNVLPEVVNLIGNFLVAMLTKLTEISSSIFELIKTLVNGILDILIEVTPKFMEWLSEILTGLIKIIDDNIPPFIEMVTKLIKAVVSAIVDLAPYVADKIFDFIIDMLDIFAKRIPELIDVLLKTISAIIKGTADALIANAEDLGYSIAYALGSLVVVALKALKGIILGASDIGSQIADAASELGKTVMDKLFGGVTDFLNGAKDIFGGVGDFFSDMGSDISKGVSSFADSTTSAIMSLWDKRPWKKDAKDAGYETGYAIGEGEEEGVRDSLDMHSPSKLMDVLGNFSVDGFVNGVDNSLSKVTSIGESMGGSLFGGLSDSLSTIQDAIDFDIDLNPTITPVVDLTDFDAGIEDMDEIFNNSDTNKALNLDGASIIGKGNLTELSSISGLMNSSKEINQNGKASDDEESKSGTTINLTQNNYSPEALSRTDIYRQTKNLLSTMEHAWGTI